MNIKDLLKDNRNNQALAPSTRANFAFTAALKGQQEQFFGNKSPEFYADKGITPVIGENLDEYLPETQSTLTKFGNMIAQTVVSELGLGIPKAFSDLVDVVGNVFRTDNDDYTNPVSKFLEEKQEEFRNYAPIYYDQNLNIDNGGMKDWGWWFANAPSVVSSLTLMLPGAAVTKGVSALAKLGKIGARSKALISAATGAAKRVEKGEALSKFQTFMNSDKTAKAVNLFLNNATTAAISRTVENYQEGRQVYNDMYLQASEEFKDDNKFGDFIKRNEEKLDEAGIDKNNRDEVAKYVANSAADETFKLDYLNTAFDVIQLYALKNSWKTLRNAPQTSRKIKQLNKQVAKEIGKTDEQIAKLSENVSKFSKAKDWTINNLFGSAKVIGAELSEGVEEAVNYIAQQEGMTFGNNLLTGEGAYSGFWDRVTNGFDGRLESYMNSPELHESAFWGVMGGVVFQGLGSATNRLYNTIAEKAANKESEEVKKEKRPWYWLEQLPETKRRIEEIRKRNVLYSTYVNNLQDIDKGIDIFQDKKDQKEGQLSTEELKEAARNRAFSEYITDLTMNAINNGNFDLLRAYLEDDNVRQGMIESGIFNKEGKTPAQIEQESKSFVENAVRKMDDVANEYDNELIAINNLTLAKEFKGRVPQEYIAIIATDNIKSRNSIRQQNENIAYLNQKIARLKEAQNNDPTKPDFDTTNTFERLMYLNNMSIELGYLRQQRKKYAQEPDSVAKQITLNNIDRQIELIESEINDDEITYVTALSLQMVMGEDGKLHNETTDDFIDYYNNIVVGNPDAKQGDKVKFEKLDVDLMKLPTRALKVLDDTKRQAHGLLEHDLQTATNKLQNVNKELYDAYNDKAHFEVKKKYEESRINRDVKSVARRVGELTNTFNTAKRHAIENKGKIMLSLYRQHGNIIRDIVKAEYNGDTKTLKSLYAQLDPKTVHTIKDVFKIFDFTKSYNEDIAITLENSFDSFDLVEKSIRERAKLNGEEENSTNQQDDTATQNPEPTNTPQANPNANRGQQNGSQAQSQTQPSQQPTVQPAPQNAATTPSTNPNLAPQQPAAPVSQTSPQQAPQQAPVQQQANTVTATVNIPFTTNGGFQSSITKQLQLKPNEDGTFSVINNDTNTTRSRTIFSHDGVDLTRPYDVEEAPIVELKDDTYTLVQKGTLVNTDTLEYQQRQEQATQQQQGGPQVTNPSTGEVVNQVTQQPSPTPTQREDVAPMATPSPMDLGDTSFNPVIEEDYRKKEIVESEARNKLRQLVIPVILDDKTKDIEEEFDFAVDTLVKEGYDRAVLESQRKVITSLCKRITAPKDNEFDSSTDELIIASIFNPYETTNNNEQVLRIDFTSKVEKFIKVFCEEFGIPTINGKKYINFEDLLRYLNARTADNLTSDILYYGLNEYLKTDEAKTKYVRTDELGDNLEEAQRNIHKTSDERLIEKLNSLSQRINTDYSLIEAIIVDEAEAEMQEAFDALNIGDEITYERIDDILIFKDKQGRIVGSNTLPQIDKKTGVKTLKVANFVYDFNRDKNDILQSKISELIYRWFTNDSTACKEIREILYKLTYESPSAKEVDVLCKKFSINTEVQQAIADGHMINITNNAHASYIAINHLGKLFKYRNNSNKYDAEAFHDSLMQWFNKVSRNYDSAIYLAENPGTTIQVSKISDGVAIRNAEHPKHEDYLPASKAIAGGVNPTVNRITYTDGDQNTRISGQPIAFMGFDKHTTNVTITNRNGSIEYIRCRPATFADNFISDTAKEIIAELNAHLNKLFSDYFNNKTPETFNALKEFILNAFDKNNHSPLFYNAIAFMDRKNRTNEVIVLENKVNDCKIRVNISENTIDIFRPEYPVVHIDDGDYNKKKLPFNDKAVKETINDILKDLRFQINEKFVNSDNRSEDANISGIVSKRSNKFIIKIGDKTWEYNSFNEFMLSNDLVALNTHPNSTGTSNFVRTSMSELDYTIAQTEDASSTTSPVEGSQQPQIVGTPIISTRADRAFNTLSNPIPNTDIAEELFKILMSDGDGNLSQNTIKALNSLKELGLLPKTIIFDENFNKVAKDENGNEIRDKNGNLVYSGFNAESNIKTGVVTVGRKWLQYANDNRTYALRLLIHEQLHLKIHSSKTNQKYHKNLVDIFNEFQNSISRDSIHKHLERLKSLGKLAGPITEELIDIWLNQINQFKYDIYKVDHSKYDNAEKLAEAEAASLDRRLEEFLVDSLMNGNLVEYLNSVETKVEGEEGYKNLFKRILESLGEIFGWNIEKGSLRQKELYSLRTMVSSTEAKDTTEAKAKQPKTNRKKVSKKQAVEQPILPGLFDEVKQQKDVAEPQEEEETAETKEQPETQSPEVEVEVPNDDNYELTDDELKRSTDDEDSDLLDESDDLDDNTFGSSTDELSVNSSENDDIRYSSTDDITVNESSSFLDAQSQLPIELRANFASMVDSATIRSQCK